MPNIKDVTVTVLQYRYPRKVIKELKSFGCNVTERTKGVYEITGWITQFAYQVVDLAIAGEGWETLKILVPGASEADIKTVCDEYEKAPAGPEKEHLETVLKISISNNEKTYEKMDREGSTLNTAAERIFKEQFEKARKDAAESADQKAREEIAETMLINNEPPEKISKMTKLSFESIVNIAKRMPSVAAL